MPDLKTIVQRMIDANESEEDINATIERFKELNPPKPQAQPIAPHEPDTFASGVLRSLGTGEAFKAGAEGGLGWLKGAITDLPETLWGAAKDLGTSLSDPIQTIKDAPGAFRHGIPAMGKQMWDTTTNAGADPEAFGRMMGQLTGQPLVTEGIIKGVPQLRAPVGKALESTGRLAAEKQPITGMIPSMFGMRTARNAEAAVGRGVQGLGQRMRLKATGVESADKLARTGPSKANKGLRSFDLKAESGTPSRNRSLPYEPRQKPVGVGEDYGNIDLEVPVNDPRIWVKRPEGVPSRSRSLPYESSGAIDLEAPVNSPPIGMGPEPTGIPSRYRDVPYEPQPTIEPPSGANLVKDKVPTVEEQMATILEQISDEGTRQPGTELPPPPFSHGEGPPTTQPVINYPSSGEIKVLLRELAKKEAKEAAEAAKKAAAKKEAAPESPRPSTVTPEQVQEVFPGLKNERPTGVPEGVDPVTGEIIELLRAKKNKSKGLWKPVMDFLKGEKGEIDYDKFFRREPDDIGNMPDEAIDLNQEVGRIEPQKTIRPEDWGDWGGDEAGLPTLIPDESGSHVAESPVAARKQLAGINPLRPDVPAGQVTNKRMFELSEQRAAENQVHPGREFADRVLSHEFDEDMLFTPDELESTNVPRMESPVENQFDPRIAPGGENILEGARERFGREIIDTADDAGRSPELQAKIDADGIDNMSMNENQLPNAYRYWAGRGRDPELANHIFNERIVPFLDQIEEAQLGQFINYYEGTGHPEIVNYLHERATRPAAPTRDVRWDADSESLFDRNTRNWDDVTDATPEEIARARGINKGTIEDSTAGKKTIYPSALDKTEAGKRGQGQSRLNSLFGEENSKQLISGESSFGPSEPVTALRESGKKKLNKSTHSRWSDWGEELLEGIPANSNKTGLEIESAGWSKERPGHMRMTYRDSKGNAVGVLETDRSGSGVANFAVSSKLGLGRGKIAFKMIKEAMDRGITKPSGETSNMTKNIFERVRRIIGDASKADDIGFQDPDYIGNQLNKILDGDEGSSLFGPRAANEETGFFGKNDEPNFSNDMSQRQLPPSGKPTLNDPNAQELLTRIEQMDEAQAPDTAYRDLSSTGARNPLAKGDTWRGRALRIVDHLERRTLADQEIIEATPRGSKDLEAVLKDKAHPRLVREDGTRIKPAGPKGEAFKVSDPSGKHLGDIDITEAQISEIQNHPELGDIPREEIIKSIYDAKLEDILEQHGVQENAKSRIKIEPKDNRLKRTEVTELAGEPTFSTTKKAEKIAADPEKAFGPDGDTRPILMEMSILERNQATDLKYKPLLPKEMQYALDIEKGETFKGRLVDLLEASKPLDDPDLVSRSATQDEFIKSTKQEHPPLRANKVKFSEKASKFAKGFLKDN